MTTFSDQLDIDSNINIILSLGVLHDNGNPCCTVMVNNNRLFTGIMYGSMLFQKQVPLLDPFKIEIEMWNKKYSPDRETAIVIDYIDIDGFRLIPKYAHLATYSNDHNDTSPTSYLGFNGKWVLDIDCAFYQFKHKITGQGWLLA